MAPILELPFMKKPKEEQPPPAAPEPPAPPNSEEQLKLKLYKLIIDRYKEQIEKYETKTVSELKAMVLPYDKTVEQIRETLLSDFHPYIFSEHFLDAAKMAFQYVSSFQTITSPVSFWLSFQEMHLLHAGDEIDKSILLCSLLRSLGCEQAKIYVTDSRSSVVVFFFQDKWFLASHKENNLKEFSSEKDALSAIPGKPLYAFNDKVYEDFAEQE
ncbi:MAG: hypothetical protein N3G80_03240 [Candidatus Micrarchaeota archaeon]|nr:hypothetical protein [Candidatus Micrarchaeota archaeon]